MMKAVINAFDQFLSERGLTFQAVVIGGAALIIMELIDRPTQDVDCLDPDIPLAIKQASIEFTRTVGKPFALREDWLNNGPASLKIELPEGWLVRTQPLFQGVALTFRTLGRLDLLRAKLYAFCDRQQDYQDCLALRPTPEELKLCWPWLSERDANPLWPDHVRHSLNALAQELGYGSEL